MRVHYSVTQAADSKMEGVCTMSVNGADDMRASDVDNYVPIIHLS